MELFIIAKKRKEDKVLNNSSNIEELKFLSTAIRYNIGEYITGGEMFLYGDQREEKQQVINNIWRQQNPCSVIKSMDSVARLPWFKSQCYLSLAK